MNLSHIEHLRTAVKSIEEALPFSEGVPGLTCYNIEEAADQKMCTVFLKIGEVRLELLESTSDEGPIAKFIGKRDEGIHHLALSPDGATPALEELKDKSIRLVNEKPRRGAEDPNITFVYPKSVHGILLEIHNRRNTAK